jgi:type I restriction enzyme S subunit
LEAVDRRLTQLYRKQKLLQTYKRGVMQKIFSQQIRFKQPDGSPFPDWERKKLGDISNKIGDGIHGTPKYDDNGEYYFINGNNLINDRIEFSESTKRIAASEYLKDKSKLTSQTILMSINGTIGNLAFYNNEKILLGKSACYIDLKAEENKFFIFYLLQTPIIKSHFNKALTGSTIKNLSLAAIKDTKVFFPVREEQQKIAKFLTAIDRKIEALSRQIDQTEQFKKGLLQKLFV